MNTFSFSPDDRCPTYPLPGPWPVPWVFPVGPQLDPSSPVRPFGNRQYL